MAKLFETVTITTAEYRPCYVDGKKALFHRWIDIEHPTIKINALCNVKYVNEVLKQFHERNVIPYDVEVIKIKDTFGVVEYEDGTIANVRPTNIKFADNKIREYAF